MSRAANGARQPGSGMQGAGMFFLALAIFGVVGTFWLAMTLGSKLAGVNADLPLDPFAVVGGTIKGRYTWSSASTWIAMAIAAVLIALVVLYLVQGARARAKRTDVDWAASYMGRGKNLAPLSEKGATSTAQRLGVTGWIGSPIGVTVLGLRKLYASVEDMLVMIAGPRVGKSTSIVIPAIVGAPGAVMTTSNKRDVLDATRDVRAKAGHVWVFDPQGIALEEPTWWWNPLSYVTDDETAAKMAAHFGASISGGAMADGSYWTQAGENILAGFLLAASIDNRPITDVFGWVTRPGNTEALDILDRAGLKAAADALASEVNGEPKRRDSAYATASTMASCLKISRIAKWVNPTTGDPRTDRRPQFDPAAFVRSHDTLYSLSLEGQATAGPLVTALTAVITEAAEDYAKTQRGGRMATPLLGVLDEAANVCRWRNLPDLYSHYGSRGIILSTILQSWSQGVAVWGKEGMNKLWSASNVKIYGGGVSEPDTDFLGYLSTAVGDYDRRSTSVSYGDGRRSTSQSVSRERILTVDDLGALPRGRAVVLASGVRPTLVKTVPWHAGPYAEEIRASVAAHEGGSAVPVAAAETATAAPRNPWMDAGSGTPS
jgi:type IV secretory pathway TraG/TraD family ATPase VirD4